MFFCLCHGATVLLTQQHRNVLEKYQTVNQEHFQNEIISELLLEVDFLPLNDLTVKMAFRNYVFN